MLENRTEYLVLVTVYTVKGNTCKYIQYLTQVTVNTAQGNA